MADRLGSPVERATTGGVNVAGARMAGVANEQGAAVAAETRRQVQDVWERARSELAGQLDAQQRRAAAGLSSMGLELTSLARSTEHPGLAADLVGQLAGRLEALGSWLEQREPATVLAEVTSFARSRPATFLVLAAGAGVLAGRSSRALAAGRSQDTRPARTGAPAAGATPAGASAGVRAAGAGAGLGDGVGEGVGGSVFPDWPASAPQPAARGRLR